MRVIRDIRALRNRQGFAALERLYFGDHASDDARRLQLKRFNAVWREIARDSPFYSSLASRSDVPTHFDSWDDFEQVMPVLDRSALKRNRNRISLPCKRPDYWRTTGGSTAEPLRLPAWRSEDRLTALDTWFARSWFGVTASDRLFLLWGHSHLFGSGIAGRVNSTIRQLKDRSAGYLRFSAYDLSRERLREAGAKLLRFRPGYVLGYSGALHRFALFNRDRASEFGELGLKVAVATGEAFPSPDSAQLIAEVFGCPVAMEYGAVETGAVAHQRPSGEFHVFWGSYYVEGLPTSESSDVLEVVITALYPRLTPLIRYSIGDLISRDTQNSRIGISFTKVIGRSNDGIILGENGFVHSETFTHALRDIEKIHAFQVVQALNQEITINYTSDETLPADIIRLICHRLCKIDGRLGAISLERVPELRMTVAGKTKAIVSCVSSDAS